MRFPDHEGASRFRQNVGCANRGKTAAMNSASIPVDVENMVHLIARLAGMLHDHERRDAIVEHLRAIAEAGSEIELEQVRDPSRSVVMKARLLWVDDDELFIGAPQIAGANRPLVRNEPLRLSITDGEQLLCCETHVIGRARGESDGEDVFGYRLAIPDDLGPPKPQNQRNDIRPKPRHYIVEAELRSLKRDIPVRGVIAALSEKMVHVRSMNAPPWLREGERMSLRAELPRPIGTVEPTVTVNSVRRVDERGTTMIGLTFVVPMHGLSKLLEHGPVRWG